MHRLVKCTLKIAQDRPPLGHKTNLNEFKIIEIMQDMFSAHHGIRFESKKRKTTGKSPNT